MTSVVTQEETGFKYKQRPGGGIMKEGLDAKPAFHVGT